jgi:cytochrome c peroxidase
MHDGSLGSLHEVVEFYAAGGFPNENLDTLIAPLDLNAQEVSELVAFLESLTGDNAMLLVRDAQAAPIGDPR